MSSWKTPKLYTWVYRKSIPANELKQRGIQLIYQSKIFPVKSMYIPNYRVFQELARHSYTISLEEDLLFHLPNYSVDDVMEPTQMLSRKKVKLREHQVIPWNIQRVCRGIHLNKGKGVRVGVIDTGIDLNHSDLRGNIKGGINIISPYDPPQDGNGHGTHVAGIIGALNNSYGVVGVAPSVSLYAIKVLDGVGIGSLGNLIKGIEWGVLQKMHILNISISGGTTIPNALSYIVKAALQRGTLIVAAAGNTGSRDGKEDNVGVPARIEGVISVAAVGRKNRRARFSSTGRHVDIAAPGEKILSTYVGNRYALLSGTSMATAHVTGVLAIYRQMFPKWSAWQLKRRLFQRALDLPPAGKDRWTGVGLVRV